MFLELVTPPSLTPGAPPIVPAPLASSVEANIESLFQYHPLQISALVETVWRNRYGATVSPFVAWPPEVTDPILTSKNFFAGWDWTKKPYTQILPSLPSSPSGTNFVTPDNQPGVLGSIPYSNAAPTNPTIWDHLIYAYLIENTRIFDIFNNVLETYIFSEQLDKPSPESQLFWRNVEALIYGDAMPTMVWTTSSRARGDETANRATVYYWMFGLDLSHAQELAHKRPYKKPAASNREFIPTFEAFAREVWRGIINAKNFAGPNDTDDQAIATAATRLYDMCATRRLNGNLSREEFRAVAIMSFLHLAVLYNSPPVVDLKATASSPEQRLAKIAERIGMTAHPRSKALFDLAQPFSSLMVTIETGTYNYSANAYQLYDPTRSPTLSANSELVIDQYMQATGRDLKARPMAARQSPPLPPMHLSPPARQPQKPNGHATNVLTQ